MKRILVAAGVSLLAACSHDVRTPVALDTLVVPNQAPWLILGDGPEQFEVKGLDQSVKLKPEPPLAKALEAQLRAAVQKDYFTNLTIACDGPKAALRGGDEGAPDAVWLELSLHCVINARGYVSGHDYRATSTTKVPVGSDNAAYARALVTLLRDGAAQIAARLEPDVRNSLPK